MYNNVFYFANINKIGGVESVFYYLSRKYCNTNDITILYKNADPDQLNRLKKYVKCVKYTNQYIKCKKMFFNYNLEIIDNVDAEKYYVVIHADYKALGVKPKLHPKIDEYICVSKLACDSFEELTGIKPTLCYNPIVIDKPKKVLNLISATRLTKEKGRDRIIKLGKILDNAGIPYLWTIFTNNTQVINNPNIVYMEPRLDITNYIANSDYLVQLSDNEGYCYSIVEALSVGTPVIVTDLPVLKEIGVKDRENGFVLDFDLNNVPLEEIYKTNLKFEYTPLDDAWNKILEKGKSTYQEEIHTLYKVKALDTYTRLKISDTALGMIPPEGYEFEVSKERLDELLGDNYYGEAFVEVVDTYKEKGDENVKTIS